MIRPSFQFYPGDWQSNAKLKRCSHAERGIWLAVLCLMHDSEEYGVLRWPLDEIATAVGCREQDLRALAARGVLKGADAGATCAPYVFTPRHAGKDGQPATLVAEQAGPIWFSSRMVRDEYVRTKRGIGSRFGEEPKAAPKPGIGDGPSSASSSSSSSANLEDQKGTVGRTAPDAPPPTGKNGHDELQTRELRKVAVEVLGFLNEKTGRNYQPVPANVDMIVARLRQGATIEDCRAVVAKKCREWASDEKMAQYLRPATLFNATKFANYQGELGQRSQPR